MVYTAEFHVEFQRDISEVLQLSSLLAELARLNANRVDVQFDIAQVFDSRVNVFIATGERDEKQIRLGLKGLS